MKVPANILGKLGLSSMLTGQVGILAALWVWSRQSDGSEWATRTVVVALAGSGAGLYFLGRALQLAARRRKDEATAKPSSGVGSDPGSQDRS